VNTNDTVYSLAKSRVEREQLRNWNRCSSW